MEFTDRIIAVSKMQKYIDSHIEEKITLDDLGRACGYSKYHALRMFKELTGRTPFEAIRAIRLTNAAKSLRDAKGSVVNAALDNGFDSQDGFARAFSRRFKIAPKRYSRETPAVNYFIHYPIEAYYMLKDGAKPMEKEKVAGTVTVSVVQRPARKLIFLRTSSEDYIAACEEVGCDWEGFYNSIPEKFDTAACGRLPKSLIKPGTNGTGFFVEVPLEYDKPLPEKYEIAEIPPCTYLYFTGMPYEDPDAFPKAIGTVIRAIETYPFERFGWKRSDNGPCMNMGAEMDTGARMTVPVEKL